jgi:RNA polymerase sigma-70 factor (ECF subfamily)
MIRFGRNRAKGTSEVEADPRDQAFAALYAEYFEPVYRYCRIRIADPHDAEDLAAAIFAKAFAAFPPAKREATRSWLFAIAHNLLANHYRGRAQRNRTEPLDDELDYIDPGALPEQIIVAADERRSLNAALSALTGDQRQVVELRLAGLTGPEIAEIIGRSHAAVKMLQLRAIERLRQILDPSIQIVTREDDHARR